MLRSARFWFGLVVSVGFLAFFLYRTDFHGILESFRQANYAWALGSIPLYFIGFWIRTIRWRYLLRPVRDVSTRRLYPVVLIGLMANNVLPARVGELVRAYLLGERENVSKTATLGTIAVDRIFDGFTLVAILGVVVAFSGSDAKVTGIGVGTAVAFGAAAFVLVMLAFRPERTKRWLTLALRFLPEKVEEPVLRLLDSFLDGLAALRSPIVLIEAAVLSLGSWLIETAMYWTVGLAFDLHVGFHVYLLIAAAANLALSVLASPGGVGPFEVATQAILVDLYHKSQTKASAYALALHALLLGPVIVVGFILLWATQLTLGEILRSPERKPEATPEPAPAPAVE